MSEEPAISSHRMCLSRVYACQTLSWTLSGHGEEADAALSVYMSLGKAVTHWYTHEYILSDGAV